jgi:protein SCO1
MSRAVKSASCIVFILFALFCAGTHVATAQTPPAINAATDVSLDQKLDAPVPLDVSFKDEAGRTVRFGEYFGKQPIVLMMPFFKCKGICVLELEGMLRAFNELKYKVGKDFQAVVISINPKEVPEDAADRKAEYLSILNYKGAEKGWHFLTGDEKNIKRVADTVGFRYKYDPKTDQYAHPAGLIVITPSGKVSKYMYGVTFSPRDLRLALTEAGENKIGTLADKFLVFCYDYDPTHGKYGLAVMRLVQTAGIGTVLVLGTFMVLMFRMEKRRALGAAERLPSAVAPTEG